MVKGDGRGRGTGAEAGGGSAEKLEGGRCRCWRWMGAGGGSVLSGTGARGGWVWEGDGCRGEDVGCGRRIGSGGGWVQVRDVYRRGCAPPLTNYCGSQKFDANEDVYHFPAVIGKSIHKAQGTESTFVCMCVQGGGEGEGGLLSSFLHETLLLIFFHVDIVQ